MTKTTARWSGAKTKFAIEAGSGHTAIVDEPPLLGEDAGMRPTEMLLGALGACTGVNAVLLLKKFRQPVGSLAVHVEGDQEEAWPKRFTAIRITFDIAWTGDFDREQVETALDRACNQYCPVDATLTHGTRIEVSRRDTGGSPISTERP
ncbi:MAG: OsmC family protein [Candidatus Dormibacteraceae bacterium]